MKSTWWGEKGVPRPESNINEKKKTENQQEKKMRKKGEKKITAAEGTSGRLIMGGWNGG